MNAKPDYTQGPSIYVSWSTVPGAADYYCQRATNAGFTTGLADSGWIPGTNTTFFSLRDGRLYYYRVKARNARLQESGWSRNARLQESGWSNVVSSTQDATRPVSNVNPLFNQPNLNFTVSWTRYDPPGIGGGASGVDYTRLYYSYYGGPYTQFEGNWAGTSCTFTSPSGWGWYGFVTRTTDNVGNVESPHPGPDTWIWVGVGNVGNVLTWNPATRNLMLGQFDVPTTGWYNLATPPNAQVYITVANGPTRTGGRFMRFDADGIGPTSPVPVAAWNYLLFQWDVAGAGLWRPYQTGVVGASTHRAWCYVPYNVTVFNYRWPAPGAWELTHEFVSPRQVIQDEQTFVP